MFGGLEEGIFRTREMHVGDSFAFFEGSFTEASSAPTWHSLWHEDLAYRVRQPLDDAVTR